MNQIKKKLHSNKGASIMLALALMLICVMVSSVIVAAAASGVARNKVETEKQQAYLAVTSAAQYIAEDLKASASSTDFTFCGELAKDVRPCSKYKNYTQTEVWVGGVKKDAYEIPTPYAIPRGDGHPGTLDILQFYLAKESENIFCPESETKQVSTSGTKFSGDFKNLMREAAETVYLADNLANAKYTSNEFTIHVDDSRIPDVKGIFEMDCDYNVKITLKCDGGDSGYSMTIELPVLSILENPYGSATQLECTHKCYYEYCNDAGNVDVGTRDITFKHEVNNTTITVTWGTPVIHKGGY